MDSDRLSISSSDEEAEPDQPDEETNGEKSNDQAWNTTVALVFRERKGLESVSLSEECQTIHIALDDWTLKQLLSKEKTTGNMTVITLTWDHLIRSDSHFYMCEIGLQNDCKNIFGKILTGLCDRNYTALRELTLRFFREFQTKITRVKYHPLSFELAYSSSDGFEKLGSRLGDIEDVLKSICSACAQKDLSLSVCLHVSDESNRDDDMDGMEFTMSLYGSESESDDQVMQGDTERIRSVPKSYNQKSKLFAEGQENRLSLIEKELQAQRETFSARFDEQKSHNEHQQQILQSLEESMKLLLRKQAGGPVSRPSDNLQESQHSSSQLEYVSSTARTNAAKAAEQLEDTFKTDSYDDKSNDELNMEVRLQPSPTVQHIPQADPYEEKGSDSEGLIHSGSDSSLKIISQASKDMGKIPKVRDKSQSDSSSLKPIPHNELSLGSSLKAKEKTQSVTSTLNLIQEADPRRRKGLKANEMNQSDSHFLQLKPQADRHLVKDPKPDDRVESLSLPPPLLQTNRYVSRDNKSEERTQSYPQSASLSQPTEKSLSTTPVIKHEQENRMTESLSDSTMKDVIPKSVSVSQPRLSLSENRTKVLDSETHDLNTSGKKQDKFRDSHVEESSSEIPKLVEKADQTFQKTSPKQTNLNKRDDNSPRQARMALSIPHDNSGALTGKARHFLAKHGIQGKTPGVRRMIEAIEAAMRDDGEMPPKAKGLNTVLCLDTSDAMGEEGFEKMKGAAMDFIDGVEDIAAKYDMEENVAVVAFGNKTRIAHHLSNDYSSVRIAVENLEYGGNASLFEALLVCMCTIDGRAAPVTFGDVQAQPRVIVMTAGSTIDDIEESEQDEDTIANNSKDRVVKLMDEFGIKKNEATIPRPVVWIPVNDTERSFLQYLAELEICRLSECEDVTSLCTYQRKQEIIGSAFSNIKNKMTEAAETEIDEDGIVDVVGGIADDLKSDEMDDMLSDIKQRLVETFARNHPNPLNMASDFDNIIELEDKGLPRLGNRVVRGPDWTGDNEDSQGPGTVINHTGGVGEERKKIWVLWDTGVCKKYRFGYKNAFDLEMVQDQPRTTSSAKLLEIGCEVTRGRDWSQKYNDQDGGAGGVGVVIRKNGEGNVKVRWNRNGHVHEYRFGKDDKLDIRIRDPVEYLKAFTAKSQDPNTEDGRREGGNKKDEKHEGQWVWQWKSELGYWQLYDEKTNEKLEREYKKRKDGSCIVQKDGDNFRVLFKTNIVKKVDGSTKTDVRRICVN